MSDADDQMGGTGGDTGAPPAKTKAPGEDKTKDDRSGDDAVTEESKESFPASDPPANY